MTASDAAIRRPVSRYGSAVGRVSTRKVWPPVAPDARSRSRCTGRVCRSPRSTLMKTGTNDAIAATATRPNWLDAPNMVFRIGVTATIGTTAIAATSGREHAVDRARTRRRARPSRMPTSEPASRPSEGVGRR